MANAITVSALNAYVKSILDSDNNISDILVEGEISNFVNHYKSGHFYFALKDEQAVIKTVMFSFNNKNLTFLPENGMRVLVRGKVSLYDKDGTYQLYAQDMFVSGVGAQYLAFEKLKQRLEKEGLFSNEYKKAIPKFPFTIGLATSATGAALHDIISVAKRRFPCVNFILAPCSVQGKLAEESIVNAIKALDNIAEIDTIIVARGGGSKEDMWVFNSENIARAAFACKKPLISAVGHEIDFTILDFVSDVRAATPTAAAEMALPDIAALNMELLNYENFFVRSMNFKLESLNQKLLNVKNSKGFNTINTELQKNCDRLDYIKVNLNDLFNHKINILQERLSSYTSILENQSPINNLKKGYSIVTTEKGMLSGKNLIDVGDIFYVKTFRQKISCKAIEVTPQKEI